MDDTHIEDVQVESDSTEKVEIESPILAAKPVDNDHLATGLFIAVIAILLVLIYAFAVAA